MNGFARAAAILVLASAACTAEAQQKGLFKGKIKPGLYETKTDMETPSLGKNSQTRKECVTSDDIETAWQPDKGCELRNFKGSGNTASFTLACGGKEPQTSDITVTVAPESYAIDMKMTVMRGGQPTVVDHRARGRYLGPCNQ